MTFLWATRYYQSLKTATGWVGMELLRLPEARPANVAMNWTPDNAEEETDDRRKTWRMTVTEDLHEMGLERTLNYAYH